MIITGFKNKDIAMVIHSQPIAEMYRLILSAFSSNYPDVPLDVISFDRKILDDTNTVLDLLSCVDLSDNESLLSELCNVYEIDYFDIELIDNLIRHYSSFLESVDLGSLQQEEPSSRISQIKLLTENGHVYFRLHGLD